MNESIGDRLTAATRRLVDSRQAQQNRAAELGKSSGPHRQEEGNPSGGTNTGQ